MNIFVDPPTNYFEYLPRHFYPIGKVFVGTATAREVGRVLLSRDSLVCAEVVCPYQSFDMSAICSGVEGAEVSTYELAEEAIGHQALNLFEKRVGRKMRRSDLSGLRLQLGRLEHDRGATRVYANMIISEHLLGENKARRKLAKLEEQRADLEARMSALEHEIADIEEGLAC